MTVKTFSDIEALKGFFGFKLSGEIFETDLHIIENETDHNDRKYHDAEVLTTIMKNMQGDAIEIGTSHGYGTYKIATNTSGKVYTLNALPGQISGNAITHAIKKEEIGKYLVQKGIKNYVQFYDNSLTWNIPEYINSLSLAFVDGCHDTFFVHSDSVKVFERLKVGGYILWHDFNPTLMSKYSWIRSAMNGVFQFCEENKISEIFHLKDSWIGFYQKK